MALLCSVTRAMCRHRTLARRRDCGRTTKTIMTVIGVTRIGSQSGQVSSHCIQNSIGGVPGKVRIVPSGSE